MTGQLTRYFEDYPERSEGGASEIVWGKIGVPEKTGREGLNGME